MSADNSSFTPPPPHGLKPFGADRERKKEFVRKLADLLEEYEDIAATDGALIMDGGQWAIASIKKGKE